VAEDTEGVALARIAICEDERIVALDIRTFLQRNGYDVVGVYASAESLLDSVDAVKPELVLMDIHLEGPMDGVEASAELMERWSIPVIFLTAYADSPTIERAKLTQPFGYVIKPFDERELKTAITIGLYRSGMEQRLRRSETRYRGLFEDGLAAIFVSGPDGLIHEGNKAFHELAPGCANLDRLIQDADALAELWRALRSGEAYGPVELALSAKEGRTVQALLSAAPLRVLEQGNYLFQAIDITERKSLQDQLNRAQKMEALGRLAGGAAHDFNNIITAILGYGKLLRDDLGNNPQISAELDGIEDAARRAAILARQLLVFSRGEEGGSSVFSLGALILELERMLGRLIGEDVFIRMRPGDGDHVRADRSRLEQVVMNLAVNARDAMPKGGKLSLSTGRIALPEALEGAFGPIASGNWAYLRVSDEGEGIDPAILPHIFEPFYSTKAPDRGTGLGLSTVAAIVRQADGHIELASELGRGTTFTVYLPSVDEDTDTAAGIDRLQYREGSGETLLLVEDDSSLRALLETLLERAGYRVLSAGNPGSALLLAENAAKPPALLVSDVVMPLMRGPELAMRLRSFLPGLRVLLISGNVEELSPNRLPASATLAKPFAEEELLSAIHGLLHGSFDTVPPLDPA
jgi:two-component system, cell cycle sensor histidine kinase and response regulator CckA